MPASFQKVPPPTCSLPEMTGARHLGCKASRSRARSQMPLAEVAQKLNHHLKMCSDTRSSARCWFMRETMRWNPKADGAECIPPGCGFMFSSWKAGLCVWPEDCPYVSPGRKQVPDDAVQASSLSTVKLAPTDCMPAFKIPWRLALAVPLCAFARVSAPCGQVRSVFLLQSLFMLRP